MTTGEREGKNVFDRFVNISVFLHMVKELFCTESFVSFYGCDHLGCCRCYLIVIVAVTVVIIFTLLALIG